VFESFGCRGDVDGGTANGELAFVGVSAASQVIGSGLTGKGVVPDAFKVGTGFRSGAEVDLTSFVDDHNLVEESIDTLSRLVERNEGGLAKDVGHDPQRLDKVQGGTGVQATSRVIPGLNTSTGGHHLRDGHPFAFTTADSANERITNERLFGM